MELLCDDVMIILPIGYDAFGDAVIPSGHILECGNDLVFLGCGVKVPMCHDTVKAHTVVW